MEFGEADLSMCWLGWRKSLFMEARMWPSTLGKSSESLLQGGSGYKWPTDQKDGRHA